MKLFQKLKKVDFQVDSENKRTGRSLLVVIIYYMEGKRFRYLQFSKERENNLKNGSASIVSVNLSGLTKKQATVILFG